MGFLAALKFLTILPLPSRKGISPADIGRGVVYFPVVGLLIGLVLALVAWLLGKILPPITVSALVLAIWVLASGALHLDGFIDTCDGLGGHKPPQARWEVMKDSRVGAFGLVGAAVLLLVKFAAIGGISPGMLIPALIITPVISRWAMVFALYAYPYARPEGLGGEIRQAISVTRFTVATFITALAVIITAWLGGMSSYIAAGLVLMLGCWVIIALVAAYFKKMFAGLTGDSYGAINEIAEVCLLLFMALMSYNGWLV